MADKFIDRDDATGRLTQKEAADASTGVADAGRVVALDTDGLIDTSMLPANIGKNQVDVVADGPIAQDALVEIFDDAGTATARLADATAANTFTAMGFAANAAVLAGDPITVLLEGTVANQTGLTPGQRLYLSETAGDITTTPVTTSGALHQFVGKALSATEYNFEPDDPIVLA